MTHPDIQECAVVGIPDEEWGERVSAGIVSAGDKTIELSELKKWAGQLHQEKILVVCIL